MTGARLATLPQERWLADFEALRLAHCRDGLGVTVTEIAPAGPRCACRCDRSSCSRPAASMPGPPPRTASGGDWGQRARI